MTLFPIGQNLFVFIYFYRLAVAWTAGPGWNGKLSTCLKPPSTHPKRNTSLLETSSLWLTYVAPRWKFFAQNLPWRFHKHPSLDGSIFLPKGTEQGEPRWIHAGPRPVLGVTLYRSQGHFARFFVFAGNPLKTQPPRQPSPGNCATVLMVSQFSKTGRLCHEELPAVGPPTGSSDWPPFRNPVGYGRLVGVGGPPRKETNFARQGRGFCTPRHRLLDGQPNSFLGRETLVVFCLRRFAAQDCRWFAFGRGGKVWCAQKVDVHQDAAPVLDLQTWPWGFTLRTTALCFSGLRGCPCCLVPPSCRRARRSFPGGSTDTGRLPLLSRPPQGAPQWITGYFRFSVTARHGR